MFVQAESDEQSPPQTNKEPTEPSTSSPAAPTGNQSELDNIQPTPTLDLNIYSRNSSVEPAQPSSSLSLGSLRAPTRLLGTYPPEWLPDDHTDTCMGCGAPFTIIKRRHHCRCCGRIFCLSCCKQKAKLLYLDNKEARVCNSCVDVLESSPITRAESTVSNTRSFSNRIIPLAANSRLNSTIASASSTSSPGVRIQGVLKQTNSELTTQTQLADCNNPSSSTSTPQSEQQQSLATKQVTFSDGMRPGSDLSESFPHPIPSSSSFHASVSSSFSLLSRQNRNADISRAASTNKNKSQLKNITVCDELGYLPPIVISKNSPIANANTSNESGKIASFLTSASISKKSLHSSMESRSCPLNNIINIEEVSQYFGVKNVITFLLLKDFFLKVKTIRKPCCHDTELVRDLPEQMRHNPEDMPMDNFDKLPRYWCFTSKGLAKFGQSEVILVIDKDENDTCIPRDVFKIYLTLHELALRRQTLDNLGNLLFQDGLFGSKDTAGLLLVRGSTDHCLNQLVLPKGGFLIALLLQRWEVPWSKLFPIRLLLRLGHKFNIYPYSVISFRTREPVFYEVGHTIISILGDFRNFRYSITHVDGLNVTLHKTSKKVVVRIHESSYHQFNKVLDNSNNEHVLAWSCGPVSEADGHLVSVQNEDGQYETVEFYKKEFDHNSSKDQRSDGVIGASFVIFSGALKANHPGQLAKISIVEDGLLIQIQSCTMTALRNAIHYMHHFDIDCENDEESFNRVEMVWEL